MDTFCTISWHVHVNIQYTIVYFCLKLFATACMNFNLIY